MNSFSDHQMLLAILAVFHNKYDTIGSPVITYRGSVVITNKNIAKIFYTRHMSNNFKLQVFS